MRKPCTRLFSLILIVLMCLSLLSLPTLASDEALFVAASVLEAVETVSAEEAAPMLATAEESSLEETAPAEETSPVLAEAAPGHTADHTPSTYEQLVAAFAAGGEVAIVEDIALNGTVTVPAGVSVVLNLNGHSLTSYEFTAIDVCGELIIRDSVGSGSIATTHGAIYQSYYTITAQCGAVVTIEGGNFSGTGVLNADSSTVTVSGGTFTQNANANCYLFYVYFSSLNITGGTFRNLGSAEQGGGVLGALSSDVSVTGGTFEDKGPIGMLYFVFSNITVEGGSFSGASINMSEAATLSITGGDFTADSILFPPEVSVTGGTFRTSSGDRHPDTIAVLAKEYYMDEQGTVRYEPLPDNTEELAAALAAGGEVVLGRDVELTETLVVPAGSEAVLDMNGHALTAMDFTLLDVRGKLTVRDSVGTGSMHATFIDDPDDPYDRVWTITSQAGAVLIIENGSFSGGGIILEPRGGDITVNGGTFSGDSVPLGGKDCTITINGGTFRSSHGLYLFAPEDSNVTINGGTFEYTGSGNLFHPYNSTITIEDGTFSGKNIRFIQAKGVTINGGTFTGEKTTFPENASVTGGVFNILEITRYIVVDNSYVVNTGEPFLTGGTFLDPTGAVLPVDEHIVSGFYQDTDGAVRLHIVGGNTTTPPVPTESPVPSESPAPTQEPQPTARPETTPKPQPTKAPAPTAPATGDDSSTALWVAVLVFCAAGMWLPIRALGKKR